MKTVKARTHRDPKRWKLVSFCARQQVLCKRRVRNRHTPSGRQGMKNVKRHFLLNFKNCHGIHAAFVYTQLSVLCYVGEKARQLEKKVDLYSLLETKKAKSDLPLFKFLNLLGKQLWWLVETHDKPSKGAISTSCSLALNPLYRVFDSIQGKQ